MPQSATEWTSDALAPESRGKQYSYSSYTRSCTYLKQSVSRVNPIEIFTHDTQSTSSYLWFRSVVDRYYIVGQER